jgi:hypothetical protein
LYSYELVIPTDASGNPLPNRFVTDPGSPEIPAVPGTPEGPPRPIVISRNGLGDPNYYPGPIPSKMTEKWGLSQEAYNQLISNHWAKWNKRQWEPYGPKPGPSPTDDPSTWPSINKPGSGGPVLWPTPGISKGVRGV